MSWNADGQKICIVYEDGAVIVGSVDGIRFIRLIQNVSGGFICEHFEEMDKDMFRRIIMSS